MSSKRKLVIRTPKLGWQFIVTALIVLAFNATAQAVDSSKKKIPTGNTAGGSSDSRPENTHPPVAVLISTNPKVSNTQKTVPENAHTSTQINGIDKNLNAPARNQRNGKGEIILKE